VDGADRRSQCGGRGVGIYVDDTVAFGNYLSINTLCNIGGDPIQDLPQSRDHVLVPGDLKRCG
jgi:hypothetical protein